MNFKRTGLLFALALLIALTLFLLHRGKGNTARPAILEPPRPAPVVSITNKSTEAPTTIHRQKLKTRFSEFASDEKTTFETDFAEKYKPAITKWANAFGKHVPLNPDNVTPDKLAERVGRNTSYNEYVFVVDGITLGVREKKSIVEVDYLNAPKQTQQLAKLPDGSQVPIINSPVSREEILQILKAEGGTQFQPNEVRIIPTGLSGSLNGGAFVNVGGDPERGGTWKYDMVFDSEGKLGYYLKGQ
jgi:hypothetical protein